MVVLWMCSWHHAGVINGARRAGFVIWRFCVLARLSAIRLSL